MLPGAKVAIHEVVGPEGSPLRTIIGPVKTPAVTNRLKIHALTATPLVAESTGEALGPNRTKVLTSEGDMAVQHGYQLHPSRGERFAAVVIDHKRAPGYYPVVTAISSKL